MSKRKTADACKTLDDWLDAVDVIDPKNRNWQTDAGDFGCPPGMWTVCVLGEGAIAFFVSETDAFRFRLDYINRRMNP